MNTQRKIEKTDDLAAQAAAAPTYHEVMGGQVGVWHEKIGEAFRDGEPLAPLPQDSLETVISGISRWSGPIIFVAALAGLLYIL